MSGWKSYYQGSGMAWKCEKCGELTSTLADGLGPCCDPELREDIKRNAENQKKREQRRRDLIFALQSRLLTADEMAQVQSMGHRLLVEHGVPFFEDEKRRQFADLLFAQFRIRAAVDEADKKREERIAQLQHEIEIMNKKFERNSGSDLNDN